MTKSLYTNRKLKENNVTNQKRHQNLDYATIADRLRTSSWGNNSHPTGVVKPVTHGRLTCKAGKWQVLEKDWSQQAEHMQVSNGIGPGIRKGKILLWHISFVANAY